MPFKNSSLDQSFFESASRTVIYVYNICVFYIYVYFSPYIAWVCDRLGRCLNSKKYNKRTIPNKLWGQALEIQRGFVADITYWYIYNSHYILHVLLVYCIPRCYASKESSGHHFSPKFGQLSRLTPAISSCPMESAVYPNRLCPQQLMARVLMRTCVLPSLAWPGGRKMY
jgi:hypothetical protein